MKKKTKKFKRQHGTGLQNGGFESTDVIKVYSIGGQPMPLVRQNKTKITTLNLNKHFK